MKTTRDKGETPNREKDKDETKQDKDRPETREMQTKKKIIQDKAETSANTNTKINHKG